MANQHKHMDMGLLPAREAQPGGIGYKRVQCESLAISVYSYGRHGPLFEVIHLHCCTEINYNIHYYDNQKSTRYACIPTQTEKDHGKLLIESVLHSFVAKLMYINSQVDNLHTLEKKVEPKRLLSITFLKKQFHFFQVEPFFP